MPAKTIVVRYGYLKLVGEFASDLAAQVGCGTKLVCRTMRGTEICEMLTTTCANGGCSKSISRDKMLAYIDASGGSDYPFSDNGRVLRVATAQDLAEQAKLDENRKKDITVARDLVVQHHLAMKIVEVEYLLGRERVLFYFTSEQRIDFRSLVRDLAHQIHSRIELRQVGARDEARLTADYEKCGQHCCCKQFLKVLTPISMRSAKIQKATLDPAKISGRCGRLMCCLRYEDQTYEQLRKKLPRKNTRVKTDKGDGWVVDGQILTQLVLVQYDDFKREAVPLEKILAFDQPRPKLPDGRTMQSPNDRMPEDRNAPRPLNGPAGGARNGPPRRMGRARVPTPAARRRRAQPHPPRRPRRERRLPRPPSPACPHRRRVVPAIPLAHRKAALLQRRAATRTPRPRRVPNDPCPANPRPAPSATRSPNPDPPAATSAPTTTSKTSSATPSMIPRRASPAPEPPNPPPPPHRLHHRPRPPRRQRRRPYRKCPMRPLPAPRNPPSHPPRTPLPPPPKARRRVRIRRRHRPMARRPQQRIIRHGDGPPARITSRHATRAKPL